MNLQAIKRAASNGDKNAKRILDLRAGDDEQTDARSEQINVLKGKAHAHTEAGEHLKAADAHEERGRLHEQAGEHECAKDAYKDAIASHQAAAAKDDEAEEVVE